MLTPEVYLARELDAAWIIALWKAVHGGDPSPETVAAEAIAALAQYLGRASDPLSFPKMEKELAYLGIQVTESNEIAGSAKGNGSVAKSKEEGQLLRQYRFQIGEQVICVQLPKCLNQSQKPREIEFDCPVS
jgi:hypothetical protein